MACARMSPAVSAPLSTPLRVTAKDCASILAEKFPEVAGTHPRAAAARPASMTAPAARANSVLEGETIAFISVCI